MLTYKSGTALLLISIAATTGITLRQPSGVVDSTSTQTLDSNTVAFVMPTLPPKVPAQQYLRDLQKHPLWKNAKEEKTGANSNSNNKKQIDWSLLGIVYEGDTAYALLQKPKERIVKRYPINSVLADDGKIITIAENHINIAYPDQQKTYSLYEITKR